MPNSWFQILFYRFFIVATEKQIKEKSDEYDFLRAEWKIEKIQMVEAMEIIVHTRIDLMVRKRRDDIRVQLDEWEYGSCSFSSWQSCQSYYLTRIKTERVCQWPNVVWICPGRITGKCLLIFSKYVRCASAFVEKIKLRSSYFYLANFPSYHYEREGSEQPGRGPQSRGSVEIECCGCRLRQSGAI